MKNYLFRSLPVCLLMATVLVACKKDDDKGKQPVSLLTQKAWIPVFVGFDYNNDGVLNEDYTENSLAECQLDDTYVFKANGTFMIHANTNGCGTDGGPYDWKLAANGIDFEFSGEQARIVTLSETTLKFYITHEEDEKSYYVFKH
jgi:hypothetical protein